MENFLDRDVFSVVSYNGKKQVKMEYYFYHNDESFQLVKFTWCYVDVPATEEKYIESEDACKQYQSDYSDEEYREYCESVLSKLPVMSVEDVNENTPDGTYISPGFVVSDYDEQEGLYHINAYDGTILATYDPETGDRDFSSEEAKHSNAIRQAIDKLASLNEE